jgi:hypothetical protein
MFPIGRHCARPERSARVGVSLALCWLAAAGSAGAQHNLSFEDVDGGGAPTGWSSTDDAVLAVDATVAAAGQRSLKLTRSASGGVTRIVQRVPATSVRAAGRAQRVRLAGLVRASTVAAAALWLRTDGPRGPLFLDSYGYGREPVSALEEPPTESVGDHDGWQRYELELPLSADVEEIAFGISVRGQGPAWFDALELTAVSTDAWPPPRPAAARYVDAAIALMREHSLRRADVDWHALRDQALAHARGAATAADAHLAVRFAVRELGDRHSYLQSAAVTQALATTAVSNARTGAAPAAPFGERVGGVAYVRVPSFAGGTPVRQVDFAEQLKDIVQRNDEAGVCGWVVDLRQNSGGNLWPMLAGLGPLLGEGEVAASVYPDGRRIPIWHRDGQAGFGQYTQLRVRAPYRLSVPRPLAVLIGPQTASSAEVLAVALGGRAGTRSFGAPTRGLSAGNRTFPLADGASLVLTVAATSDAAGRVFAGPLMPDVPVTAQRRLEGTGTAADPVLEAALAWLPAGDACR